MNTLTRRLQRAVLSQFPLRGQACIVMTRKEFDARWSKVVARLADMTRASAETDISCFGSVEILLRAEKEKLLARIAWDPDDWPQPAPTKPILAPKKTTVRETPGFEHLIKPSTDCLRVPRTEPLRWRMVH